jgi:thioredoxin 1
MTPTGDHLIAVTDDEWDDRVLEREGPVLVDFWAPWCVPCTKMEPAIRELAARHADRLTVATLNVDDHPRSAGRYDVLSLPTLVLFVDGRPVERIAGPASSARLEAAVEPHLTD